MAELALFSYAFTLAVLYSLFLPAGASPSLFGLSFERGFWPIISVVVACVLNLQLARNARYLSKLLRMYQSQRRELRFYAFNNGWLANPFRWVVWIHRPISITPLYVFLINVYAFPPILNYWSVTLPTPSAQTSYVTSYFAGALMALVLASVLTASSALTQHANLLWGNKLRILRGN